MTQHPTERLSPSEMFNWFRKLSQAENPVSQHYPLVGIPVSEVAAALALVETLPIDHRILGLIVEPDGCLQIQTGHSSGFLSASLHYITLERQPDGWHVVRNDHLVS